VRKHNRAGTLTIEIGADSSSVFGRKRDGLHGRWCSKCEHEGHDPGNDQPGDDQPGDRRNVTVTAIELPR
jgi:hypothetical protein